MARVSFVCTALGTWKLCCICVNEQIRTHRIMLAKDNLLAFALLKVYTCKKLWNTNQSVPMPPLSPTQSPLVPFVSRQQGIQAENSLLMVP